MAFDEVYDSAPADFDPDAVSDESESPDPEEATPVQEEDPLQDLDGDTRALVEQVWEQRQEAQRQAYLEQGLDVSRDGRLLIADQSKVAAWAGAPAPRAQSAQPVAQTPQPAAQAAEDPMPELDPMTATAEDYRKLTQWEIRQAMKPLMDRNQHLEGLMQRRAESDAMQDVRSTVERLSPELLPALDHPDFEAAYRQQIASVGAEFLEDPVTVASIAYLVRARLDPSRMPAPRDTQGRFTGREQQQMTDAQRLNQAARASIGQTPPARGGGSGRAPSDPDADRGARYLAHMRGLLPPALAKNFDASSEAWQEAQYTDFERWNESRSARKRAETTNGRRR